MNKKEFLYFNYVKAKVDSHIMFKVGQVIQQANEKKTGGFILKILICKEKIF